MRSENEAGGGLCDLPSFTNRPFEIALALLLCQSDFKIKMS